MCKLCNAVFLIFLAMLAQSSFALTSDPTRPYRFGSSNGEQPQLKAVYISRSRRIAVINDGYYQTGDLFEGMKIVAIRLNAVSLENQDGEVQVIPLTEPVKQVIDNIE